MNTFKKSIPKKSLEEIDPPPDSDDEEGRRREKAKHINALAAAWENMHQLHSYMRRGMREGIIPLYDLNSIEQPVKYVLSYKHGNNCLFNTKKDQRFANSSTSITMSSTSICSVQYAPYKSGLLQKLAAKTIICRLPMGCSTKLSFL
eukprot:Seg1453.4 transcript_id=Seg1453.4/GoldUCD/mRNA.D3Y31 product="hypothetical protein" protein_id=Seg1453.4/GoldUCD/D3Y31